jgi:hypothetical protein
MGEGSSGAGVISFTPNPSFEAELMADPESQAAMMSFKDVALTAAQDAAPVLTGRYRDSLFADEEGLGSTSSFWALIEYGSVNDSPSAPLRRGVEATGVAWSDP